MQEKVHRLRILDTGKLWFVQPTIVFLFLVQLSLSQRVVASVDFIQLTDPHLFGDELENEQALKACIQEINSRIAQRHKGYQFVVVTGDLGIEDLVSTKDPESNDERQLKPNLEEERRKGAEELADVIAESKVKVWLFVPGNNDLVDENPDSISYYNSFVADLSDVLRERRIEIINLSPQGDKPDSGIYIVERRFAFVGFNNASFKSNNSAQNMQEWNGSQLDEVNKVDDRLRDVLTQNEAAFVYIFYHIPEVDDPYYVLDVLPKKPADVNKWIDKRGVADSPFKYSAWTVKDDVREAWNKLIADDHIQGLFAGHFHDWRRKTYQDLTWLNSDANRNYSDATLRKLHICPPVAIKNQWGKPDEARGFREVSIADNGKVTSDIAWYRPRTFEGKDDHGASSLAATDSTSAKYSVAFKIYDQRFIFYGAATVLAILPMLMLASFFFRGVEQRRDRLRRSVKGETRAKDLLPEGDTGSKGPSDGDARLSDVLVQRFDEIQRYRNYLLPLVCFHIPYLFGLLLAATELNYRFGEDSAGGVLLAPQLYLAALGFLGAAIMVVGHIAWRVVRNDINANAFLHLSFRLIFAPALGLFASQVLNLVHAGEVSESFIAFAAGTLPTTGIRAFVRWATVKLGSKEKSDLPLQWIQGIDREDELRLWEEGITDVQQLAVARLQDLVIKTSYSLERLVDWQDQACLCIYVGEELQKWRSLGTRSALDILGMAEAYYGKERHSAIVSALAKSFNKPEPVMERLIDTIYNDPRVHELWGFLKATHPAEYAKPIVPNSGSSGHDSKPS